MNILYTESSPNTGGQELQAVAQMAALMRAGHKVMLACRKGSGIAAEAARQGIRVEYIPFRNSLHLRSVSLLRKLILRFRSQMVVCHSGHDSHVVWLTRATLPGRVGRFCIIRQKTYLTRKCRMFSLNHLCDAVVVPSPSMREALVNAGCQRLIAVATPGVLCRAQAGTVTPGTGAYSSVAGRAGAGPGNRSDRHAAAGKST